MTYQRIVYKSNTKDESGGAETVNPHEAPVFIPGFSYCSNISFLCCTFYIIVCSLFLLSFNLWLLITPSLSSNFSFYNNEMKVLLNIKCIFCTEYNTCICYIFQILLFAFPLKITNFSC